MVARRHCSSNNNFLSVIHIKNVACLERNFLWICEFFHLQHRSGCNSVTLSLVSGSALSLSAQIKTPHCHHQPIFLLCTITFRPDSDSALPSSAKMQGDSSLSPSAQIQTLHYHLQPRFRLCIIIFSPDSDSSLSPSAQIQTLHYHLQPRIRLCMSSSAQIQTLHYHRQPWVSLCTNIFSTDIDSSLSPSAQIQTLHYHLQRSESTISM